MTGAQMAQTCSMLTSCCRKRLRAPRTNAGRLQSMALAEYILSGCGQQDSELPAFCCIGQSCHEGLLDSSANGKRGKPVCTECRHVECRMPHRMHWHRVVHSIVSSF